MKIFVLIFALIICFPASLRAQDDAPIGMIAETEGDVTLIRFGEVPGQAAPETAIYLNDVIETAAGAKAHILFIDETELTLGEQTHLSIDNYVFDADSPAGNSGRFRFLKGTFIFTSGLITKLSKPDVILETAYGSIGIRGTTVWGGEIDNEYGIFVASGEVQVKTLRGQARVRAGEGTSITSRAERPSKIQKWSEVKIERAKQTVRLARAESVKERVERLKQKHEEMREKHREMIRQRLEIRLDLQQREQLDYRERRREQRRETFPNRR